MKNNSKQKWYVVWRGVKPGVYETWSECKRQVNGFNRPLYKSFFSGEEAEKAYRSDPQLYIRKEEISKKINYYSLSVDAACSGNPGLMEYRGVYTNKKEEIFRSGLFQEGTNNIGEFLAIVHGLMWLKQQNLSMPIYSDSKTAILWVQKKECRTELRPCKNNKLVFDMIEKAEKWLKNNNYMIQILKWNTKEWGEIFADFNRK